MDFASLKDQVSNLSLYDLKAGVRKVQNGKHVMKVQVPIGFIGDLVLAVMNYTEMEAKVSVYVVSVEDI